MGDARLDQQFIKGFIAVVAGMALNFPGDWLLNNNVIN